MGIQCGGGYQKWGFKLIWGGGCEGKSECFTAVRFR